jgi:hypothetical protein
MFKGWDFGEGIIAVVFVAAFGTIGTMIFLGDSLGHRAAQAWVSIWWLWVPPTLFYFSRPNSK